MKLSLSKHKVYESLLVIVVGFCIIQYFTNWLYVKEVALLIGVIGILSFFWGKKIATTWLKMAEILGQISSRILLSVVFFLFLTPLALLYRIFSKKTKDQDWIKRNHQFSKEEFEKVW